MKYIISTLGCKVNQYETQAMETILREHGHDSASIGEIADAVIVNTCAVTAESGRKSRQTIRRLKDENPGAVVAVCGCYSQIEPKEIEKIGADVIFGAAERVKLVEALEKAVATGEGCINIDKPFQRRELEKLPAGAVTGRTRAMLKIQDGCVNFCTYCIIPYTRGRLRSLPIEDAVAETERINSEGFREIVLTGIEVAAYGSDLPGKPDLADVIVACADAAPDMRIRLGSLEPTLITENFCRKLADTGKLCRHFHLSLQSGCDKTLKGMNRKYDTAVFYEKVEMLRKYFPGCALTADLITGFPGETEEDHRQTLEFIRKVGFTDMHIFPYSRRPGTPADKMPNQIENAVKAKRAHEAQKIADTMHRECLEAAVGKTFDILFESGENGVWTGHTDTYLTVKAAGEELHGQMKTVKITGIEYQMLTGEIVDLP